MKKVLMLLSISLFLFSCGETNKTENVVNCEIKMNGNIAAEEQLFNHVKQNPFCKEYIFVLDYKDDYGNVKWEPFYKVINFNKGDYEEMKKYNEVGYYLKKYGSNKKWDFKRIK